MTFKKSMISIAAATVIAAGITGYIYNATVKAFYLSDDNTTMKSVPLTAKKTTKNTNTLVSDEGGHSYALAETNTSIKDRIRYFEVTTTASNNDGNITFTPAAYIENTDVKGYDANDTLIGTTVIYAPANSGIASPLTSLAVVANPALFGTAGTIAAGSVELNATTLAQIDSNLSKIATNLGLGDLDLKTADPIDLATANATFKLVTALLKDANAANAATILAATPATTLAETLAIVVSATTGNANAKTVATILQAQAANGALSTADILKINIEQSVSKGAKLLTSDTLDINMTLASADANVSNTSFELLVAFKGTKDSMEDDTNTSSSIVASIPFDMNITSGNVATDGVAAGSIITYQVKAPDGSSVVTKSDMNASKLVLTTAVSMVANSDILKVNIDDIISALVTAADANTTGSANFTAISDVQILLKDSTGSIVGASDEDTYLPLAKSTFSDIGTGAISGVATGVNAKPTIGAQTVVSTNTARTNDDNATIGASEDIAGHTIVSNHGTAKFDMDLNVTATDEVGEQNSTITIANLPSWVTAEYSTINVGANDNMADFNLTVDGNKSGIAEGTTVVSTLNITDEFGKKSAADTNLTFMYNLAPAYASGKSNSDINETNSSGITFNSMFINLNGVVTCNFADSNVTADANLTCAITPDGNLTITDGTASDANTSCWTTFDINDSYGASFEINTTIIF